MATLDQFFVRKRPRESQEAAVETPSKTVTVASCDSVLLKGVECDEWRAILQEEVSKSYFKSLERFVLSAYEQHPGKVYPPREQLFAALNSTPLSAVKVVIIGQDPYHGPNQANGLCFSVNRGVSIPASLRRIYAELERDPKITPPFRAPSHGSLVGWAKQGVLLLNATLTVLEKDPNAHSQCGWQTLTDALIAALSAKREGVVYMLWGQFAIKKAAAVNKSKNCVLTCAHPSPFTRDAWLNNGHFSKANEYLESRGEKPIVWANL